MPKLKKVIGKSKMKRPEDIAQVGVAMVTQQLLFFQSEDSH